MSVAERRRRRIAQPAFWSRQAENTLDRATAMMPRLLYERLRRVRHRFRGHLPDRRAALAAHRRRRHPARRDPRLQHRLGGLLSRPRRPDDAGGDHPDAHPRRGDRRARIRHQAARLEGRHVRQRHAAQGAGGRGQRPRHRRGSRSGTTCSASTATTTTTRSGRSASSWASPRPSTAPAAIRASRLSPTNFCYNHIGHFAAAGHATVQGDLPRRRHPALPGTAVCVSRRRRRLGLPVVRRPDRALGAAQAPRRWSTCIRDKLDRALLMSLVEKYGYADMVDALAQRGGWPDPTRT